MEKNCLLGIDGGGTKTSAVLIDPEGTVLAREDGPRSNIHGRPHQEACDVLAGMAQAVFKRAGLAEGQVAYCVLGLNGVDLRRDFPVQREVLCACLGFPAEKFTLVNDAVVALWGASPRERAAVLQLGTGITSAFRTAFGQETLFDHLDTGHTFDIRTALTTTLSRMIDGRVERTPLLRTALDYFGIEDEDDYREVLFSRRIPKHKLKNTVPLIYAAWEEGDPAATGIMEQAIADYLLTARAMLRNMDGQEADMVFGGGVIMRGPGQLWDRLRQGVTDEFSNVQVCKPILSPVCGAAVMAAFNAGMDRAAVFKRLEEQEYNQ